MDKLTGIDIYALARANSGTLTGIRYPLPDAHELPHSYGVINVLGYAITYCYTHGRTDADERRDPE